MSRRKHKNKTTSKVAKVASFNRGFVDTQPIAIKNKLIINNPGTGAGGYGDNSVYAKIKADDTNYNEEALSAYKNDDILQQIIEKPVLDALSEWRNSNIPEIEAKINYQYELMLACNYSRLFGTSLLMPVLEYPDGGKVGTMTSLDKAIENGANIKFLKAIKFFKKAETTVTDLFSPYHGRPVYYEVNEKKIHHSRVIPVHGSIAGSSKFQSIQTYYNDFHIARQESSRAEQESNFLVLKTSMQALEQNAAQRNANGEDVEADDLLEARLRNLRCNANNNNAYGIDKEFEDLEQIDKKNIDDIVVSLDKKMQILAGSADIPMSTLFAQSKSGLSSNAEIDKANIVQARTSLRFFLVDPVVAEIDDLINKTENVTVNYEWNPLAIQNVDNDAVATEGEDGA